MEKRLLPMIRMTSLLLVAVASFCRGVFAQGAQNSDFAYLLGPVTTDRYTISGANVAVRGSSGIGTSLRAGHQLTRAGFTSLWIEFCQTIAVNSTRTEESNAYVSGSFASTTLGIRLMTPLNNRLSVYGAFAGGLGFFDYPTVVEGFAPYIKVNSTRHGVFEIGGGLDLRLTRLLSIRGEVRDVISGRNLSGSTGPHHLVPVFGLGVHF